MFLIVDIKKKNRKGEENMKTKTKKRFNLKKLLTNIFYLIICILFFIVVYNRLQDITGLEWFFTTF